MQPNDTHDNARAAEKVPPRTERRKRKQSKPATEARPVNGAKPASNAGSNGGGAGSERHALIKSPVSREDSSDHGDDARREAVAAALRQLQELLNQPVTEETRSRWFAPEILCALVILQDHKPDQFGALSERLRSRRIIFSMWNLDLAMAAHRSGGCKVGHAPVPPSAKLLKTSQPTQIVNLAHAQHVELFHDAECRGYAMIAVEGHKETWPITSKRFEQYLRVQFHTSYGKVPAEQAVRTAVAQLNAEATTKGAEHRFWLRVAEHAGKVYVDLCNEKWEAVEITADRWSVVSDPPVKFLRMKGMLPLPTPLCGGTVNELRPFVNVASEAEFRLVVAFLLAGLQPERPKPGLAVSGEQGSGKSVLLKVVRLLIDPNEAEKRPLPKDVRSLMIAGSNSAMLTFDNVSRLPPEIADALSSIMTGAGHAERALYTDADETLFKMTRAVIFNGIPDLTERGDLAERMISLVLPEIPTNKRRDEAEFWTAFERARPRILGALCDAVVGALRELPTVKIERLPRMADAAKWITAAEKALGWEPGTFLADFRAIQEEATAVVLDASPVPAALVTLLVQSGKQERVADDDVLRWHGTPEALHTVLLDIARANDQKRGFPAKANALSTELRRMTPALRTRGILVERGRKTDANRTRFVKITGKRIAVVAAFQAGTNTVQQ